MTNSRRASAVTCIGIAIALMALARGLPPDTFVVGDPGVKLIAASNAIAHPARPLELPLPSIGGDPVPYVEPFFVVHGEHAHAVTTELFPLLTAPFLAWFGSRGAYVWPGLGFLLSLASWAWLAIVLDPRRNPLVVLMIGTLATPLLFYGLEFWEHAPAVAAASAATALFAGAGRRVIRARAPLAFASGLLFGLAVLLRPEAAWYAAAVLIASPLLPVKLVGAPIAAAVVGIAVAIAPLAMYTLSHFGTVLNPHVGNIDLLTSDWLSTRAALLSAWFVVPSAANAWRVAPALLLALAPLAGGVGRVLLHGPAGPASFAGRKFLVTVSLITVLLVIVTAPHDGGGQWGPRFLLLAYGPLVVLTADVVQIIALRRWTGALVVILLVAGSGWIQRTAYRELRVAKRNYTRILEFVRSEVPPGGYLITDVWWLDQVAAAAAVERQFLYAPDGTADAALFQRLNRAEVAAVTLIRSRETPGPPRLTVDDRCYAESSRREVRDRALVAIHLRRVCES